MRTTERVTKVPIQPFETESKGEVVWILSDGVPSSIPLLLNHGSDDRKRRMLHQPVQRIKEWIAPRRISEKAKVPGLLPDLSFVQHDLIVPNMLELESRHRKN